MNGRVPRISGICVENGVWKCGNSCMNESLSQISGIFVESCLRKFGNDIQHRKDCRVFCKFAVEMWKWRHECYSTSDFGVIC